MTESLNLSEYFLEQNLPASSDKTCIYFGDETYTYQRINDDASRAANLFRQLGVRQEDRVLIMLPDRPEFVTALFGVHKIGAVLTMANPRQPADALIYYLNYTRAPVAVIHESIRDDIHENLDKVQYTRQFLVVGGDPGPFTDYAKALADQSPKCTNAIVHPDDPAVWLFSSGTSGHPKGAIHLAHDFPFNTERYAKEILQFTESDRTLGVPKLFFGYATGTNLWFPFRFGGSTILFEEHPTPETMFANIAKHRPTFLTLVPTTINKMLAVPDIDEHDLSCVRVCVSAGEALPPELYRRWMDRFDCEILDGIGSAEMFHIYISNRIGDVKEASLGKLVPGYSARIVDPDQNDVPTGEIGTLWINGDSRMVNYFQDNEKSRHVVKGEWVNTGDQFTVDEHGYYWYKGRADDMLKVGGLWVAPGEIENCLLKHPAVKECAVIGCEDENLVKPKAFVVLNEGHSASDETAAQIINHAREYLAKYKAPRWVTFIDILPRSDRGKILRRKLAEM
jgi:benzoate-CoA ligase